MNIVKSVCPLALGAVCSVALAIALACGNAVARDLYAAPQRVVRYSDLNLNHPDGVKVLYRRLATAARAVCQPDISVPQTLHNKARNCARMALDNAVAQVNNANLTAYHDAKSGRQSADTKVASRP